MALTMWIAAPTYVAFFSQRDAILEFRVVRGVYDANPAARRRAGQRHHSLAPATSTAGLYEFFAITI